MNPLTRDASEGLSNTFTLLKQVAQLMSQMMTMQVAVTASSQPESQVMTRLVVFPSIDVKFDGTIILSGVKW
jgi:hypothetical protein